MKGTCCHGNRVRINPWELRQLAIATDLSVDDFQNRFTTEGGLFLRFDGPKNKHGKGSCLLFNGEKGCSVHYARPLACRLFPLGRQKQGNSVTYFYEGDSFPCLNGCDEVLRLPRLTVQEYFIGQEISPFEQAQDGYLEVVQNLADIALSLVIDTDLNSMAVTVLQHWRILCLKTPKELLENITVDWKNALFDPMISRDISNVEDFIVAHNSIMEQKAEQEMSSFTEIDEVNVFANEILSIALYLSHTIGADAADFAELWITIAARELNLDEKLSR